MRLDKILWAIIWAAISLIALFFFLSCNTPQKAMQTLDQNPKDAAKYCADKYPVKDSIIVKDSVSFDTIYVGEDVVFDTVYENRTDTVVRVITKTLPAKVVTKTVTQVKEVFRENTARVTHLEISLADCNKQVGELIEDAKEKAGKISALKKERNKWRLYFFVLLFTTIAWKFRKGIFSLIK